MLPSTEDEKAKVADYFLGQSSGGTKVLFLQKVYSESIIGHKHDVWDVHAEDGRWWIITNPTNLYSQEQFPNMDLAVTFHVGLCLRIPRTQKQREPSGYIRPFAEVYQSMAQADDALSQADAVADFQAIGMRCRECLLAFVAAAQDHIIWTDEETPKRADFRAWSELICNVALSGETNKERRSLFKKLMAEAWAYSNWLTHSKTATWHDAEVAFATTEHVLGFTISLVLRHVKEVPEKCPKCGSSKLWPENGYREDIPHVTWERPVCSNCGWRGAPAIVDWPDSLEEVVELITREGAEETECVVPEEPLRSILRPGEDH
ncbi:MAG: hypothetical protein NXH99_13170 [Rhodobacteraceae bacterium]|nr:hypothetical protein [Paracoccaceae bacterium]